MNEKNFITSGRNTLIHKNKKFDLLVVNGSHPVAIVSHTGIDVYNGAMPNKRAEAKKAYQEGRPILDVAKEQTDISHAELVILLDPKKLTEGGI